jgi:hypothetical protein
VIQPGEGLDVAIEGLPEFRHIAVQVDDFNRNRTVRLRVGTLIDFAAAARSYGRNDLVGTEFYSSFKGHE